jgi:predicted nucleic acid-binding Zn ribbon protein
MENQTLFLKAKNSIWRNELKLRQKDLLNIIYEKTGNKLITNIIFL